VYEHAAALGARRLGAGPKARLRFNLAEIDERMATCPEGRKSSRRHAASEAPSRPRLRRSSGTDVQLLPIRRRT
jgi:hypothetical protein